MRRQSALRAETEQRNVQYSQVCTPRCSPALLNIDGDKKRLRKVRRVLVWGSMPNVAYLSETVVGR